MTQHLESSVFERSDAMPIGILLRLMSSQTTTMRPEFPLFRVRGLAEAYQLAAIAYDIRRVRQLVVMSPDKHGWQIDPVDVMLTVGDHADVVMLDDRQTTECVAEALTRPLAPFSGYIRILRPGLSEADGGEDGRGRHPGVKPGFQRASPQHTLDVVRRKVNEGLRVAHALPARPLTNDDLKAAVEAAVSAERAKAAEATTKLATLKRELRSQQERPEDERPVFADPHAQFRYDLHRAWLKATEEGDRPNWPLREWELGPVFLDSIDEQQIVDRAQVIRACVDVITGRHKEINSRASHKLRMREGGNSPAVVRDEDGAAGWRCSVNSGPAAARLMWWELGDFVELSVVATHDDIRIA